jgi:signal transduction histidine kinase
MERSLNSLNSIIDNLPRYAKEISSKQHLETICLDLFLADTVETMRPVIQEKKLKLELDLHSKVKLRLDRIQMSRAILNMVKNSIEATTRGSIRIRSYIDKHDIVIQIEDTGTGIPEKILGKLFTPFVTSKKDHGTGLGLSGAKSIIERHLGTVSVKNLDSGAQFTICFPRDITTQDVCEEAYDRANS